MKIKNLDKNIFIVGRDRTDGVNLLGTCFLLNKSGLFATAAHVANSVDDNLVVFITETAKFENYQDTSHKQGTTLPAKILKFDPIRDICILKVDHSAFSKLKIGNSDNVNVTDEVGVVGFPHCTDGRKILTYQNATIGAKILIESSGIKSKHLVLNILTRPGQSGSPIFRLRDSLIVGMIIGTYAPTPNTPFYGDINALNQTTYGVSTEYLLNMI